MHQSITRVLSRGISLAEKGGCECLVTLHGPRIGQRFSLQEGSIILGRDGACDIVLESDSVSRRHARLNVSNVRTQIIDLDSTNGTYVNEHQIETQELQSGDLIRLGDVILKFLCGHDVESAYHEEIYRLTIQDGLTSIANRRYLYEFLEREMARARRRERELAIVLFDIDHFKHVNDSFGHIVGDSILRELAALAKHHIQQDELLARCGGEEFCVVLPETSLEEALYYAEQLRTIIAAHDFEADDIHIPLTISLGVALFHHDMKTPADFIRIADSALYRAKHHGRNRVES